MIFQHTIDKVLSGEKTQTRRIVEDGQWLAQPIGSVGTAVNGRIILGERPLQVVSGHEWDNTRRIHYEVGKTYALQRGRGMKAEGRIRITGIRREDVRDISEADVKAEGFASYEHFVQTWCHMHDAAACREADKLKGIHICGAARTRPAERYQAWAITFELVKESDHASK